MVTVDNLIQLLKVQARISVTPLGIITSFKLSQPANASLPIFVTLSGIVILAKLLQ